MKPIRYGFGATCPGATFDEAVQRVTEALKAEGFGVLTEIDVQATLRKKLGAEFRPYVILGACNPPLAHHALSAEPEIGLLLPCNVVVRETDTSAIEVAIGDPKAMFAMVDNDKVAPVAEDVEHRLRRVLENVASEKQPPS